MQLPLIYRGTRYLAFTSLAVIQMAQKEKLSLPSAQMLVCPLADTRMQTKSMKQFTDTPLWNSTLNETQNTIHGYDIDEKSRYVKEQVRKRIQFLVKTC